MSPIPVTVFTGFLGAGKTTIILSLLPQLPKDYKVVLLKNEYGDVEVDSKLVEESSLTAVSEILNGCMCCVLVGQMQNALLEIRDTYRPDRIIIECSGSAFPATLAFQIRELERQTDGDFKLDSIITVVDAENFTGYEDTSPTAKMQASYTDIILVNKSEHVSERQLDTVLDHLHTLNDLTPKILCRGKKGVNPKLIFGIESQLFSDENTQLPDPLHEDEVQTLTLYRGLPPAHSHSSHGHDHDHDDDHDHGARGAVSYESSGCIEQEAVEKEEFVGALEKLDKESVWRVKGFVRIRESDARTVYILNWAFGRYDLTQSEDVLKEGCVKLTAMGQRGELRRAIWPFCRGLDISIL